MSDAIDPKRSQKAEHVQRLRIWILGAEAGLFLTTQLIFLIHHNHFDIAHPGAPGEQGLAVGVSSAIATLILTVILLVLIGTGGFLRTGKNLRAVIEDETTQAHRRAALVAGYWAAMVTVVGVYVLALFEPVTLTQAIRLVLIAGVCAPLLRFAQLEWCAIHD